MTDIIRKKIKLFILAILLLIVICILFSNHINNQLFVRIDNSAQDIIISDVENIEEEIIIADNKIKKEKKLNDVKINIKVNGEYKNKNLLSNKDIIELEVLNLKSKYSIYYSLKYEEKTTDFKLFDKYLLQNISTPNKFNLLIKIVTKNTSKIFDLGEFKIYDIIYEHNKTNIEETEIGTIYNEDGTIYKNNDNTEYLYTDININKNIVIDNIEEKQEELNIEEKEDEINIEEKETELKGNIYIIEETDLNNINITGHLYIETEENVAIEQNVFEKEKIHSITIKNKVFKINEKTYSYEFNNNEVQIHNSNNELINIEEIIYNSKAEIGKENDLSITKNIKDEETSSFNFVENSKSNLLQ